MSIAVGGDASGKRIFHSGAIKADGILDESAHVYKQIILDEKARPITRHQILLTNIKAYDNAIPPGRSDVARFTFRAPDCGSRIAECGITLRARVNYRRLNQEYTNYVLARQKRQLTLPIVRMAEVEMFVVPASAGSSGKRPAETGTTNEWKRWNDYGIGLLEQAQYGAAASAFRRASELSQSDPDLPINAAIAEMRAKYLTWRDDPRADGIAARFFAAHPQWADERIPSHNHNNASPQRAILAGPLAAPEK